MAKLYLIAVIIVSTLVPLISAVDITGNSTMFNGSFPSLTLDKVGNITMLGSMAMVARAVILLYYLMQTKATATTSFFYALAFILWIIGLALTHREKMCSCFGSNDEKKNNEEKDKPKFEINNWAIVDILLKLNGFILNILFIMNNAKSAGKDIYNLSIIIVILSGLWNVLISLLAISSQPVYVRCVDTAKICCCCCLCLLSCLFNYKPDNKCNDCKKHNAETFSSWLEENKFVATILVAGSFISLEFLEFSTSRWGRSEKFNSKMNRFGKFIVFYGAIVNIYIQDIPRFIILIVYYRRIDGKIPVTLIVNGINIFVAIISRIFYCIILITSRSREECNHQPDKISLPNIADRMLKRFKK